MDKPHKKVLAPLAPSLVVLDKDSGRLAATDNERIYVTDVAGKLHCLDARTGECCWVHETGDQAWGGPLVADDKLYFGNKKNFYIMTAGREPKLLSTSRMSAPIYSTPIAANGVLYVASNRYLWATQVTP